LSIAVRFSVELLVPGDMRFMEQSPMALSFHTQFDMEQVCHNSLLGSKKSCTGSHCSQMVSSTSLSSLTTRFQGTGSSSYEGMLWEQRCNKKFLADITGTSK